MQATRVHEGGVLRHETVPDPVAGPGEVVVELRAAALNRRDLLVSHGTYPYPLPLVPGSDGAGVRRDTGEEVVIDPSLFWGERSEVGGLTTTEGDFGHQARGACQQTAHRCRFVLRELPMAIERTPGLLDDGGAIAHHH
jgi:D-arabinose 1-dehydrogenase-like Zn-dependent alcohol dehydrogenase